MATAKNQAQLQTYIEQEVATISPLKQRSELLKKQVADLNVDSSEGVEEAKKLRKDIIAHEKEVNDLRMGVTRQLNDVTKTLIAAERDVLAPAAEAKAELGKKVVAYEEKLEAERRKEQQRVTDLIKALVDNGGVSVYQIRSLKALGIYEDLFESRVTALDKADAKISDIISVIAEVRTAISEQRDKIRRLDEESNEAKRNELEREAEAAKAAKEAELARKTEAKADDTPKTGSRVRTTFEIVKPELVPRDLCTPNETLIREYIKAGATDKQMVDFGIIVKRERVL